MGTFVGQSVVASDTVSSMVKLAREIDESASDVVGNGTVSIDTVSAMVKLARKLTSGHEISSVRGETESGATGAGGIS